MTQQTAAIIDHPVIEQIDAQEDSGDPYDCLDDNTCHHPGGHVFFTSCGETKCIYCPRIAWT